MKKAMTLVEILVGIGIFSLIIILIFGTFLSGVKRQRTSIERQNVLDNIRYLTEVIAREMRMAKRDRGGGCLGEDFSKYTFCLTDASHKCISRPSTGTFGLGSGIKFLNYNNYCIEFFKDGDFIKKKIGDQTHEFSSKNVKVVSLNFELRGESPNDNYQPRVLIFMEIEGAKISEGTKMIAQTVVSSRELDTP